ncbi:MAG: hypothetical protein M1821_003745 [Bathelium mastoideum]|nr:MAG: hypothetical protein M1821_003745 [Bathelium mastoideum]KAI9690828.1 MAG: hypothetical protein M1822_008447 [Bathelium mastoideum]
MTRKQLGLALLLGSVAASPAPKPQVSIPAVPSIPGVTEPLGTSLPPGIILQPPTPPLPDPDPNYTPSEIKPKKIGFFFAGAGDNEHADFLASYSLDDDTFGTLLRVVDLPTSGNSPHHLGASYDGTVLWGGGLLSLLKTQNTGYYFDVSDVYNPAYKKSDIATLSSIADEVRAKPDGGFFFTYMGSAIGTSPGRLVETDANYTIIHQWPEDVPGVLSVLDQQFDPHGLSIDWDKNLILTSDFLSPITILKPSTEIVHANTLRLWDLTTRTILNTITIPNGGGIQDVKFIPGNPDSAALATAVHLGQVWIIYPFKTDANGNQGTAELYYDLGDNARDTVAIFSDITQDGRFAYFTYTTGNHVAALDISNISNPIRLDDPNEDQPITGPHYVKVTPDQQHLVVTDYFLQTGDIGLINTPADYKAQYIDINPDGSLSFNRSIDFQKDFENRGGAKPHSSVIYDLSDPSDPKWL